MAFWVGVQVAWDRIVGGHDQGRFAVLGELELAAGCELDVGQARQAGTKPEIRIEIIAKPSGAQGLGSVDAKK